MADKFFEKQRQKQLDFLDKKVSLDIEQEERVDDYLKMVELEIPTTPIYRNTEEELKDRLTQKQQALTSLRTILNPDIAFQAVQSLDGADQLIEFNSHFIPFKSHLAGRRILSEPAFMQAWDSFKRIKTRTSKADMTTLSDIIAQLQTLKGLGPASGTPTSKVLKKFKETVDDLKDEDVSSQHKQLIVEGLSKVAKDIKNQSKRPQTNATPADEAVIDNSIDLLNEITKTKAGLKPTPPRIPIEKEKSQLEELMEEARSFKLRPTPQIERPTFSFTEEKTSPPQSIPIEEYLKSTEGQEFFNITGTELKKALKSAKNNNDKELALRLTDVAEYRLDNIKKSTQVKGSITGSKLRPKLEKLIKSTRKEFLPPPAFSP